MALQGTLKDFGIADILQLVGQQQKTGTLTFSRKNEEVHVLFKDGSIVKAESAARKKKDLIGTMLVDAEVITAEQLEAALETQRRTLQRVGDVLVSSGVLSPQRFRRAMQLQMSETLYGLFSWKTGRYHFEQGEIDDAEPVHPVRAEAVLMEGFRRVDEWPLIRKLIPQRDLTFEMVKRLPQPGAGEEFPGQGSTIGEAERAVFAQVRPGRDVAKLIAVSWLGEFETYKALFNLVNLQYLRPVHPGGAESASEAPRRPPRKAVGVLVQVAASLGLLWALAGLGGAIDWPRARPALAMGLGDAAAQRFVTPAQLRRIEAALEVYRLEKGELPENLEALVKAQLLSEDDLHYPWQNRYHYRRRSAQQFVLLPPLR